MGTETDKPRAATATIGRPSKFSPKLIETICLRIAEGESLRSVCRDDAMPDKRTVMRWLTAHDEFRDQYVLAREVQADHFADEMIEIADDATNDWMERKRKDGSIETVLDNEHVQRSKLRVDARKWLMARMAPKKYGDRTALDVEVRRSTEDLSDDELTAIARGSGEDTSKAAEGPEEPDRVH